MNNSIKVITGLLSKSKGILLAASFLGSLFGAFTLFAEEKNDFVTIEDVANDLDDLEAGDLAVFDCDDVLLYSPFFTMKKGADILQVHSKIMKKYNLPADEAACFMTSYMQDTTEITSHLWPAIIRSLQDRGVLCVVLTQAGRGRCGAIEDFPAFRTETFKKYGIDFGKQWEGKKILFDLNILPHNYKMVIKSEDPTPAFIDGVIYCGAYPKGAIFADFINKMNLKPKKMIYVDDSKSQLAGVSAAVTGRIKEIKTINFQPVEHYNKKLKEIYDRAGK